MARTDTLTNFLTDVASAIKTKKGDQTDILASNFDTEIANLPSGGDASEYFVMTGIDTTNPKINMQLKKIPAMSLSNSVTSLNQMFNGCTSLQEVDVSLFTKSGITNMGSMFYNCENLETITGFEEIDTQAVTTFGSLFYNCKKLVDVDLSNLDFTAVTNIGNMFYHCDSMETISLGVVGGSVTDMNGIFNYCENVTEINLPNFTGASLTSTGISNLCGYCYELVEVNLPELGTTTVNNLGAMFRECRKLKRVIMPKFNTTSSITSTASQRMFYNCSVLELIDMRSFDWTKIASVSSNMFQNVPNDCEIIVADATQKAWFTTNVSRFTNVKTVAELGVE